MVESQQEEEEEEEPEANAPVDPAPSTATPRRTRLQARDAREAAVVASHDEDLEDSSSSGDVEELEALPPKKQKSPSQKQVAVKEEIHSKHKHERPLPVVIERKVAGLLDMPQDLCDTALRVIPVAK